MTEPHATAHRLPDGPVRGLTPVGTKWWAGEGTRPVVAVDVDRVVCAVPRNLASGPSAYRWRVFVPAARQRRSAFHAGYGLVDYSADLYIPKVVAPALRQVQQVADVIWCTTWAHQALEVIAAVLGVGHDWPVLDLATAPARFAMRHDSSGAKSHQLEAVMLRAETPRPVLWVDDRPDPRWTAGNALGGLGAAVRTNPTFDWTEATTAAVMEWLERVVQPRLSGLRSSNPSSSVACEGQTRSSLTEEMTCATRPPRPARCSATPTASPRSARRT